MAEPPSAAERRALKRAYLEQERRRDWATLGLSPDELAELLDELDDELGEHGCDHSYRFTRAWLRRTGRDDTALAGLRELGGGCDCEVLANVDLDAP